LKSYNVIIYLHTVFHFIIAATLTPTMFPVLW